MRHAQFVKGNIVYTLRQHITPKKNSEHFFIIHTVGKEQEDKSITYLVFVEIHDPRSGYIQPKPLDIKIFTTEKEAIDYHNQLYDAYFDLVHKNNNQQTTDSEDLILGEKKDGTSHSP